MLEIIRSKIMGRINTRRLAMSKKSEPLCVKIKTILDKNIDESVGMTYIWNGMNGFEVKGNGDKYSVDNGKCHCSCGAWQLSGIPCAHAIVCLRFLGKTIVDCVPECYKKSTFLQTYTHMLNSMCGMHQWNNDDGMALQPSVHVKLAGRPKKEQTGHNQRSCPNKKQGQGHEVVKVKSYKKKAPEPVEAEPAEPAEAEHVALVSLLCGLKSIFVSLLWFFWV
ncbi:hypothetical protein LIER_43938 [Lithospermum erythrorhizon]|uniref:SWIM-type domain-containing protein n=1 Tax=Lithospermum erythrorhizon TaxID=34254 RepID=A0AAV3RB92_LITER